MGTVAIGLVSKMPEEIREALFAYVQRQRWANYREVSAEEVWSLFESCYAAHVRGDTMPEEPEANA